MIEYSDFFINMILLLKDMKQEIDPESSGNFMVTGIDADANIMCFFFEWDTNLIQLLTDTYLNFTEHDTPIYQITLTYSPFAKVVPDSLKIDDIVSYKVWQSEDIEIITRYKAQIL